MPAPVVTPGGPLAKRGKQVTVFTATNDVDTWTASGGTFLGTSPTTASWQAPNVNGTYTVTATNEDGSDIVTITVTAVVPTVPTWGFEADNKKKVLLFEAQDGSRQTRTKGPKKQTFNFTTARRPKVEFVELEAFWNANYPGSKVYFTHPGTGIESLYWIDSDLKEQWSRLNLVSYSFVLKEA